MRRLVLPHCTRFRSPTTSPVADLTLAPFPEDLRLRLSVPCNPYPNPARHTPVIVPPGAALAVSTGMAAAALCTDVLGSARVPAACCGVYAYRATPGAVGHANAAASDSSPEGIESVALMAADPAVLLKGGQALGAPGGSWVRGRQCAWND